MHQQFLQYVANNLKKLENRHKNNITKYGVRNDIDIENGMDIFHDSILKCYDNIKNGITECGGTDNDFYLYLLKYSFDEFKQYIKKKPKQPLRFADIENTYVEYDEETDLKIARKKAIAEIPVDVFKILELKYMTQKKTVYLQDRTTYTYKEIAAMLNMDFHKVKNIVKKFKKE